LKKSDLAWISSWIPHKKSAFLETPREEKTNEFPLRETRQNVDEFTGTYEYKWPEGLLSRAEYRRARMGQSGREGAK
jgi:hypothetical protein